MIRFWMVALLVTGDPAPSKTLEVHVVALHSDQGKVGCTLWRSDDGFPSKQERAADRTWCPISRREATCQFRGLQDGEFAVACFHDENGNGRLDTGFLGIPKEGVAVSRDAKGFMGPPKYKNAKLSYPASGAAITVTMTYL